MQRRIVGSAWEIQASRLVVEGQIVVSGLDGAAEMPGESQPGVEPSFVTKSCAVEE
jgi:hypothetical protein